MKGPLMRKLFAPLFAAALFGACATTQETGSSNSSSVIATTPLHRIVPVLILNPLKRDARVTGGRFDPSSSTSSTTSAKGPVAPRRLLVQGRTKPHAWRVPGTASGQNDFCLGIEEMRLGHIENHREGLAIFRLRLGVEIGDQRVLSGCEIDVYC